MNSSLEAPAQPAPSASIVVPVYNGAKYLRQCLDSLASQSEPNIEVIVVDDGSIDDSFSIATSYRQNGRFVALQNSRNLGTFHARLRGMLAARGDFIGSVDSDDWVEEDFVKALVSLARKEGSDIAQCRLSAVLQGARMRLPWADVGMQSFSGSSLAGPALRSEFWHIACNKLFSRHLLEQATPFYEGIDRNIVVADDKLLMLPIYFHARSMASSKRRLYMYRQRADSATNNRRLAHDLRHVEDTAYVDEQIHRLLTHSDSNPDLLSDFETNRRAEVRLAIFNAMTYPVKSKDREALLQKVVDVYGSRAIDHGTQRSASRREPANAIGMHSMRFQLSEIYFNLTNTELAIRRFVREFYPAIFPLYDMPRRAAVCLFRLGRSAFAGK